MRKQLKEYGFSDEVLARHNIDENKSLTDNLHQFTVGETFFYRHPEQFDLLRNWSLGKENIKVLSAPCSTGEEVYSIAHSLCSKSFTIDAIDANEKFISKAKAGKYTVWSVSRSTKNTTFLNKVDDEFIVQDAYRQNINWMVGNVFDMEENQFDVIFCRNLMIYFDRENIEKLFAKLERMLKPNGLLFISPSDPRPAFDTSLNFVTYNNTIFAIKNNKKTKAKITPIEPHITPKPKRVVIRPPKRPSVKPSEAPQETLDINRAYDVSKMVMDALTALESGDKKEAQAHIRKAHYLECDEPWVIALYGMIFENKKVFHRVLDLLDGKEDGTIVNYTDDILVSELRAWVMSMLSV